jgi:hypothetical protein
MERVDLSGARRTDPEPAAAGPGRPCMAVPAHLVPDRVPGDRRVRDGRRIRLPALRASEDLVTARGRLVARSELIDLTSVTDGRTHLVALADFERGVTVARGRYLALCGAELIAAPMVTRPGPRCPHCTEHRRKIEGSTSPRRLIPRLAQRGGLRRNGR